MARGKPTPLESLRPWFNAKLAWAEDELESLGLPRKAWLGLGVQVDGSPIFQPPLEIEPSSRSPLFFQCPGDERLKLAPGGEQAFETANALRLWMESQGESDYKWRGYWTAGIAVAANNGAVFLSQDPILGVVYARVIEAFEAKRNMASRGRAIRKHFAREWNAELGKRPKTRRNDPRAKAKERALQLHAQGRSGGEIRLDREFRKAYVGRDGQPLPVDAPERDSPALKASIERNIRNWTRKTEN